MFGVKSISTAVLALGLTAALPSFVQAAPARPQAVAHREVRVERHDEHVERAPVGRDLRVERDVRVERDIHIDRDEHHDYGRDWDRDRGHVRIDVGPVYVPQPVYVPPPVYVPAPVYVQPDVNVSVALPDVPSYVLNTVETQIRRPIETIRFVRENGFEFYQFMVGGRPGDRMDVHVATDGRLLSAVAC